MKKVFTILSLCVLMLSARHASAQAEYDKGNVLLNAGLGLGYYFAGGVPLIVSAEFAINDAITIGPYLGYTSWRYSSLDWSYTFIDIGGRGAYHFSKHLNMNTTKLDLYGGLALGYVIASYSGDNFGGFYNNPYGSSFRAGLFGGARYYFTNSFGVYGEVGLGGVSPAGVGITFKL